MNRRLLPFILLGLLFACGASDGEESGSPADTFPDTRDGAGNEVVRSADMAMEDLHSALNISGSWAQLQVVATIADAPLIGHVETLSIALVRWEIAQAKAGQLTIEQDACDLALTSENEFVQMVIPSAFVDSIVTYSKPGHLDVTVDPPQLDVPLHPEVHGAILADDLNDPMPDSADDPRVVDGDNDGQPGLTVYITGVVDGALYVVQRNMTSINGIVSAPDRMEGLLGFSQEQIVLGSDNSILRKNPPLSAVDPDPAKSYFISVRVPAKWQCDEIVSNRDELFDDLP